MKSDRLEEDISIENFRYDKGLLNVAQGKCSTCFSSFCVSCIIVTHEKRHWRRWERRRCKRRREKRSTHNLSWRGLCIIEQSMDDCLRTISWNLTELFRLESIGQQQGNSHSKIVSVGMTYLPSYIVNYNCHSIPMIHKSLPLESSETCFLLYATKYLNYVIYCKFVDWLGCTINS